MDGAPDLPTVKTSGGRGPFGRRVFASILQASQPLPQRVPLEHIGPNQYHQGTGSHRKSTVIVGARSWTTPLPRFFLKPADTLHRRYEALRAYFVERRPTSEIAAQFGYTYDTLRSLIRDFRAQCRDGRASPLFAAPRPGRPPRTARPATALNPRRPRSPIGTQLDLGRGRRLRTRVAGIFLFLPLLARLRFDRLVAAGGLSRLGDDPGHRALLSLLALKLLDKERRSHISDFNCDEALGLFAGLNVLPKTSFATEYSYRTRRDTTRLLSGWVTALAPLLFPEGQDFSLDFHAIPFRGDPAALDNHYLPMRGKAGPSVLSFFAQEQQSRVLCYANANLTRADQPGEVMRFVEFWHAVTGQDPHWLYFDSKVVPYPELSRVNRRGIHFVTIRRRGAGGDPPPARPAAARPGSGAVIDTPKRRHQHIRFVDERIRSPATRGRSGNWPSMAWGASSPRCSCPTTSTRRPAR